MPTSALGESFTCHCLSGTHASLFWLFAFSWGPSSDCFLFSTGPKMTSTLAHSCAQLTSVTSVVPVLCYALEVSCFPNCSPLLCAAGCSSQPLDIWISQVRRRGSHLSFPSGLSKPLSCHPGVRRWHLCIHQTRLGYAELTAPHQSA